jgi:hypothetical protein
LTTPLPPTQFALLLRELKARFVVYGKVVRVIVNSAGRLRRSWKGEW